MIVKQYPLLAKVGLQTPLLPRGGRILSFQFLGAVPTVAVLMDDAALDVETEVMLMQTDTVWTEAEYGTCIGTAIDVGLVEWYLFYPRTP